MFRLEINDPTEAEALIPQTVHAPTDNSRNNPQRPRLGLLVSKTKIKATLAWIS